MQIIRENDIAAHVVEVDDDGDVAHARAAFFGDDGTSDDPAMIRYWNTPYGVVLQSMHSDSRFRGRDMMKWLTAKYGSVNVVEATWEAWDFWKKMKREGMVRTISGCDEPDSREMEANAIPFTLPLSERLNENYYDRVPQRYDTKPAFMVPYEDNEEASDQGPFPVWENPSRNTFKRIIENGHGSARGLIFDDGRVLIWDQRDLYHSDVGTALQNGEYIAMQFFPDQASCKGEDMDETPYEGDDQQLIRTALRRYYPEGFTLTEFNWL